jgi:alpha-amylase
LSRFHLVLLLHAHQPVGNFEDVFERAYRQCYLPFLDPLERHPGVHVGLHFSGPLWEWLDSRHGDYLDRLRGFVDSGQVELVGGGFYEPILISIPHADRLAQIRRMEEFIQRRFAVRPRGAWLTERIWEPHLPQSFGSAGVGYTLVDDNHFLLAGFEPDQLFGYYRVEDLDAGVDVFPGLENLRYFIPFHNVEESVEFLRGASRAHPGGMAAMGDDLEKFGSWPGTYDHCYTNGWLERFFAALESNADWLSVSTPDEFRRVSPPLGRAALPTAAYSEMMEWSLPTPARLRVESLVAEFAGRPDIQRSLRRGTWRGFLVKYPESDLLVRKMEHVSRRLRARSAMLSRSDPDRLDKARTHLLRAQCNDAYWHGIFGGLYSPHLRDSVASELVEAERLLDGDQAPARVRRDGLGSPEHGELYFTAGAFSALLDPADGATLSALDFRAVGAALVNSIARRPEAYHSHLARASASGGSEVASIHDRVRVKEPGLDRLLRYDRWRRNPFRLLLFGNEKQSSDYAALALGEASDPAGASFRVVRSSAAGAELEAEISLDPMAASRARCVKTFRFRSHGSEASVQMAVSLAQLEGGEVHCCAGIELVLNRLAPASDDRYFAFGAERHPLGWQGVVPGGSLRLVDEWKRLAVEIFAPGATELWIAPVETVSESEDGFERVYQGSQILALWPLQLAPGVGPWLAEIELRLAAL